MAKEKKKTYEQMRQDAVRKKRVRAVFAEMMEGKIFLTVEAAFKLMQKAQRAQSDLAEFLPRERMIKINQVVSDLEHLYYGAMREEIDKLREDLGYDRHDDRGGTEAAVVEGSTKDAD